MSIRNLYAHQHTNSGGILNIDAIYKDMLESVLNYGVKKTARSHETYAIPCYHFAFDLSSVNSYAFPLLGLKYTHLPHIASELYCFIHGLTGKHHFHEYNNHIWDEWCNPQAINWSLATGDAKKELQLAADDLGPIYGYQWRNFGQEYKTTEHSRNNVRLAPKTPLCGGECDQLQRILDKLLSDPNDRRLVCSAWNPAQINQMALPPCHILWNLVVVDGHLNLHWHQRSCDLLLGVPFNIASYALLLKLLAKHANLEPGMLFASFADFHIYKGENCNHVPAALELLERTKNPACQLDIAPTGYEFNTDSQEDQEEQFVFWDWKPDQYELRNYLSHKRIKLPVAV